MLFFLFCLFINYSVKELVRFILQTIHKITKQQKHKQITKSTQIAQNYTQKKGEKEREHKNYNDY
jgi:hypothetical protein